MLLVGSLLLFKLIMVADEAKIVMLSANLMMWLELSYVSNTNRSGFSTSPGCSSKCGGTGGVAPDLDCGEEVYTEKLSVILTGCNMSKGVALYILSFI